MTDREAVLIMGVQLDVPCPFTTWEEYIKSEGIWADVL